MSSLAKRVITALILAAAFLSLLFFAPVAYTIGFLTLAILIGLSEWAGFGCFSLAGKAAYVLLGAAVVAYVFLLANPVLALLSALAVALLVWAVALWALLNVPAKIPSLVTGLTGYLILIPAWLSALVVLTAVDGDKGPESLFLLFWIVAAADTGAYFTGKNFGKNKLLPQVSPGKTREGFFGGMISAIVCACLGVVVADWSLVQAVVTGLILAPVSVVGDLTVSLFKRNANLKDSGAILPGHGGVLDRIDGVIAALPFYVVVLIFFEKLPLQFGV